MFIGVAAVLVVSSIPFVRRFLAITVKLVMDQNAEQERIKMRRQRLFLAAVVVVSWTLAVYLLTLSR